MTEIHGTCLARYEKVREAFARCFTELGELGAATCVWVDGEPVVDLWGGTARAGTDRAWERDTLGLVFSTTKGVTAICVNRLVEQGKLDLGAPVAEYWPEFVAQGKGAITLADVLTHRAGLAAVEGDLTLDEVCAWDPVCAAIAAQAPNWEPGTKHGYHARSYGWMLGEIVRRVTGETLGSWFSREIAKPLDLDFYIGLPPEHEPRVATLVPPPEPADEKQKAIRDKFMGPDTLLGQVLSGPAGLFTFGEMWNEPRMHEIEMPSSNGIGTARALAKLYAATIGVVDGQRVLAAESVARAATPKVDGPDAVIMIPTRFGLGFMLPPVLCPSSPDGCFGHPGAGGSLAFADPERGLAFGYVMNRMQLGLTADARAQGLVEALYESL